MGLYQSVRELWKQPRENLGELFKERLIAWRREPVTVRIERPTRIDRARSLGYKAKQGYLIIRQRVTRGGRQHEKPAGGRRPKRFTIRRDLAMSYQVVAEQRAVSKYPNCEVLNSYYVGHDGVYNWYEVILIDRAHPVIKADPHISWIGSQRGRVFRGLTSSGRKARGLRNKGTGAEKFRPSRHGVWKRKQKKDVKLKS